MNEFYVERLPNENGDHVVHKHGCPSLPAKEKLRYIGVRSSMAASLREAAHFWYSSSAACPHCMGS
ncbi:hypothetical protein EZJ19_10725 [Parasulfuritortus cantonensis]|uniref:Uncharacterized protein n=1 Tax=Parasulfuritortus cantonensis TaxID=2528202 RepID=A0A4R1B4K5_9PROT|nr:hypothetical protein [Parasulfuritortus cantonensis]TCJ13032.1 hypothetical protein EZJ19_10725 [Parasulfuritortus cantonensis]